VFTDRRKAYQAGQRRDGQEDRGEQQEPQSDPADALKCTVIPRCLSPETVP
jgi:hypothetical protein